jgi:hypothetical protein
MAGSSAWLEGYLILLRKGWIASAQRWLPISGRLLSLHVRQLERNVLLRMYSPGLDTGVVSC